MAQQEEALFEIHDVDFIQTGSLQDDTGTLIVEMTMADDTDVTRTHRDVPEKVYERWEATDFDPEMYMADIVPAYPFEEEHDEDE